MKKTRKIFLSLIFLILLTGSGFVRNAEAQVRVNASLHTPNVHIRVGNAPDDQYPGLTRGPLPVRKHQYYKITTRDRMIALRLAGYTGVPARRLITIRGYGYTWFEIGQWLHLPRPVVRAAMHPRSWDRFLREQKLLAGRVVYRYERLR
ncbi:MAG TPA: hypothetical protein VMX58_06490 [Patescibacteria group bacterium]|nr:hypothetical protein [Patescibacteria group bacterium]